MKKLIRVFVFLCLTNCGLANIKPPVVLVEPQIDNSKKYKKHENNEEDYTRSHTRYGYNRHPYKIRCRIITKTINTRNQVVEYEECLFCRTKEQVPRRDENGCKWFKT